MPLLVEVRNGSGRVLGAAGESPPRKLLPLPEPDDDAFPLLRGVDEYAVTSFGSHQMRWLIPELEELQDRTKADGERQLVGEVLRLAKLCAEAPHRVLVFVGD